MQEFLSYNRNVVVCKHVVKSCREHFSTQKKTISSVYIFDFFAAFAALRN